MTMVVVIIVMRQSYGTQMYLLAVPHDKNERYGAR
jgi:hypothetical protein